MERKEQWFSGLIRRTAQIDIINATASHEKITYQPNRLCVKFKTLASSYHSIDVAGVLAFVYVFEHIDAIEMYTEIDGEDVNKTKCVWSIGMSVVNKTKLCWSMYELWALIVLGVHTSGDDHDRAILLYHLEWAGLIESQMTWLKFCFDSHCKYTNKQDFMQSNNAHNAVKNQFKRECNFFCCNVYIVSKVSPDTVSIAI